MSTFVRILKKIGRALRRAAFAVGRFFKFLFKKIGKSSKVRKLNGRISKKEKAIEKLYSEIGRSYYEAHSDAPEALLAELCGGVGENKAQIAEAQDKIAGLQAAYAAAKAEARDRAKASREADKRAAAADKAKANGEAVEEAAAEPVPAAEEPAAAPVTAPFPAAPAAVAEAEPVPETPAAVEDPVVETPVMEDAPAETETVAEAEAVIAEAPAEEPAAVPEAETVAAE